MGGFLGPLGILLSSIALVSGPQFCSVCRLSSWILGPVGRLLSSLALVLCPWFHSGSKLFSLILSLFRWVSWPSWRASLSSRSGIMPLVLFHPQTLLLTSRPCR
ncbi:hypothetical protein QBC41DRAFT_105408 [Cercophora samala]|uniref:Secreted protein n=1 Tax=Cercophora samala TaxID=330535 RepID=A0AA40DAV2_9PEZI|nr:hypothetical protein QBC41DRAFT_105408 [Cercophora samala]